MAAAPATTAPPPLATPRKLYVHDDLTGVVPPRRDTEARVAELVGALFDLLRGERSHVVVLTLGEQVDALLARAPQAPFDLAIGIGAAGERVARQLHARAGWFPHRRRVGITREEDGRGGYTVVSTEATSLSEQLSGLDDVASLAVVDDTVFSGLTLRTVLEALPPATRSRTRAFCLRAVAETLATLAHLCPVTAGFAAPGRILEDVSFINASGLVMRGAIRRAGAPPMAFFERAEWMRAWFPTRSNAVTAVCRELNALLAPPAAAGR